MRTTTILVAWLLMTSSALAWAINQPTPPSNILRLTPGSTTRFCESLQNLAGDNVTVVLKLEIIKSAELASFVKQDTDDMLENGNLIYVTVPFGMSSKRWCLDIAVPAGAVANESYEIDVKASKKEESMSGQVRFALGQIAKIFIQVKGEGVAEQFSPPNENGTVSNQTQDLPYVTVGGFEDDTKTSMFLPYVEVKSKSDILVICILTGLFMLLLICMVFLGKKGYEELYLKNKRKEVEK